MFKGKSLKFKLILSFCVVAVITLIVGFIGWRGTVNLEDKIKEISDENIPKIRNVALMREYVVSLKLADRSLLFDTDQATYDRIYKSYENAIKKIPEAADIYEKIPKLAGTEAKWKETRPILNKWIEDEINVIKMIAEYKKTKNPDTYKIAYDKSLNETTKDYYVLREAFDELEKMTSEYNEKLQTEAIREGHTAILLTLSGMILGALTAIMLGVFLSIAISKPINKVVDDLLKGAEQVAAASEQLSETSQQLAEGSSENAASIEETSSTISETSSMVQQNTENTREAAILSIDTKKSAEKENAEMGDMLSAMEDIKKSSSEISKIIKVIDDIAFQTNILSLNAAVEAARAGEAGAGFAVVAEEVRNLAQRSAQAAKDTATMIETSVERAATGVTIAKKVADSLNEITGKVEKVHAIMDEINVASQEQAQGIGQINKAVSQMEQVTQSIAANAEESASASEQLNAQAENMKEIVEDLIHIVSGDNDDRLKRGSGQRSVKKAPTKKIAEVKEYKKKPVSYGSNKTKAMRPDDVIPLEDDTMDF
jgi:uncharacterized phage infection (PIP) family protein YhgE